MKKIYLVLLCSILFHTLFSQKETNNWVFGFSNTIDFNTIPPTTGATPTFDFFADHCPVSMSDEDGNLLFYSDGNAVFDKNHEVMPNGFIQANFNATNPIYLIPKPNSSTKYYLIINLEGFAGPFLQWKEIDMTLNGGLGDISSAEGFLTNNPTGKITAVSHQNQEDIWIVSHPFDSDEFHSWLVTENGVSTTPVISTAGSFTDGALFGAGNGQIKTSVNGDKIALVDRLLGTLEIFDFDNSTGQLYNDYIYSPGLFNPYGIEFSPTGQYIYVSHDGGPFGEAEVLQFDLWSGDILISKTSLGSATPFNSAGALQLSSDGKIYLSTVFNFFLGSINSPNQPGLLCDFQREGLLLDFSEIMFGLPTFFHKYFQTPYFTYQGFCTGSTTSFIINSFENTVDSVFWDFGDSLSSNNFSTSLEPTHNYPGTGAYIVTLTIYSGTNTFVNQGLVNIAPTSLDLGSDLLVCDNEIINLDAFTPNATYDWSNDSTQPSINITEPGTYWVEVSVDTCPSISDTISINHLIAPTADLGGDGGICNGTQAMLDATNPNSTYSWSTGSTTSSITIFFGGDYTVTVTNTTTGCTDVDEVFYQFDEVLVNPNHANIACHGDSNGVALVFPIAGIQPFSYLWNDGDTLYTNNNLSAGNYSITVTDAFGCSTIENFNITEPPLLEVNTVINSDNTSTPDPDGAALLQTTGGVPPYTYTWDAFGEVPSNLVNTLYNSIYNITITDSNGCEEIIEIIVGDGTSTDELTVLENINIFPNPAKDLIYLKIPQTSSEDLEIKISNSLGQLIGDSYFLEKGETGFSIDVSNWSGGIYFLKIKSKEVERILKVLVSN